jgi:hypothetical protein
MLKKYKWIWPCAFALLVAACTPKRPSGQAGTDAGKPAFFDIKAYFTEQAKAMEIEKPSGLKIARFQNHSDTLRFEAGSGLDFEEELQPFISSDINRPAWQDKYRVDTLRSEGLGGISVRYTAVDESLKTRKIELRIAEDTIRQVQIENQIQSVIAHSVQKLRYEKGRGYAVFGTQRMRFGKSYDFEVSVRFR